MEQTQRGIATEHSNNLVSGSSSQMPHVLFREIHKNAFLKKHSSDRRGGFPRKSERVWVVFCVHDDVEAFLEIYPDQKVALTHKPEWFTSLANALHVSPSICGHEDEFEFAITLSTQVIRLAAPSWEAMMEWVDTIRNKLRELKVLSPKENLYSKMPEQKQPLLPTRDPNSPLPLPPDGPSTLLPGVEPVHLDSRTNIADSSDLTRYQRDCFIRSNGNHERRANARPEADGATSFQSGRGTSHNNEVLSNHQSQINNCESPSTSSSTTFKNELDSSKSRIGLQRTVSVPEASTAQRIVATTIPTCSNITVIEVSCPSNRNSHSVSECSAFDYDIDVNTQGEGDTDDVFVTPPITPKVSICDSVVSASGAHYEHVFLPSSTVTVDNTVLVNSSDIITDPVSSSNGTEIDENSSHEGSGPCTSSTHESRKIVIGRKPEENMSQQVQSKLEKVTISGMIPRVGTKHEVKRNHQGAVSISIGVEDIGETEEAAPSYSQVKKTPKGKVKVDGRSPVPPRRKEPRTEEQVPSTSSAVELLTASVQPTVGLITVEDIPLIGGHQRRRRRSSSSEAPTSSNIARGIGGADRIRINVTQPGSDVRNEAEQTSQAKPSARLTLREQQVLQLRREMMHPGGVRLQLRRKECIGSIALVDALTGVWVAGWKQREHPMLYNALHIGDQLVSVSDVVVRNAADAQRIIRSLTNTYIELIIRRVPFGRVFALHRSSEGQNLGIVQEGNTAEIKDIVPNSVAARAGLSAKTPSTDGLSLTTWFLTEVNGRPLNLFFKDNEVRDRLNSVGKDISILVQPHDFIKQIKKNLKNIRSYKEYIVQ